MSIPSKLLGSGQTRIYSLEFAAPGKWTCVLEIDEFKGNPSTIDTSYIPNVCNNWIKVRKELVRQEPHYGVYRHTYEGLVVDGPSSPTDPRSGEIRNSVIAASVSLNRQPIAFHPDFQTILDKYGGKLVYGQWDWPQKDPTGNSSASGVGSGGQSVTGINPLYAVQEYLAPSMTIRITKADLAQYSSPQIPDTHGYIDTPPSTITAALGLTANGGGSGASAWSPWLLTEHSVSQHGAGLEITKGWSSGQWNNILYNKSGSSST